MKEMSDHGPAAALERQLARLPEDVGFPPTPTFTLTGPAFRPTPRRLPSGPLRSRWWQATLVAAVVLFLMAIAIPQARHAIADWFSFPGIRIELGDRDGDPPQIVTSIGGELLLGNQTSLDEAQAAVTFPLLIPEGGSEPEVYINSVQARSVISLIFAGSETLPEIGTTGVGLLLMEIDASGDTPMMLAKRAMAEWPPQTVDVRGSDGVWIQGGVLLSDAGDPFWTYQRRSGNVLIWEQNGVTFRMECNLPLTEALALAESLAPLD